MGGVPQKKPVPFDRVGEKSLIEATTAVENWKKGETSKGVPVRTGERKKARAQSSPRDRNGKGEPGEVICICSPLENLRRK